MDMMQMCMTAKMAMAVAVALDLGICNSQNIGNDRYWIWIFSPSLLLRRLSQDRSLCHPQKETR